MITHNLFTSHELVIIFYQKICQQYDYRILFLDENNNFLYLYCNIAAAIAEWVHCNEAESKNLQVHWHKP